VTKLSVYEIDDSGTTVQLTEQDAKKFPGARKVGTGGDDEQPAKTPPRHDPPRNRARR